MNTGEKYKIRWEYQLVTDPAPLQFTGVLFILIGRRDYQCHQGKDFNALRKQKYRNKADERVIVKHNFQERRKIAQPTKKKNCPITFNVKKRFVFPSFIITEDTRFFRDRAERI